MSKAILLFSVVGALGACTTTSFAPPNVNTQHRVVTAAVKGCSSITADQTPRTIDRNVVGAMNLIDNFELAYRCAQNDLANGRRYFEVPAFLLGVAGLVGPSLGLGPDGKLLSGTGAGVLGYGNNYFAPKAKAAVVGAAHQAVVCIQAESVGIGVFKRQANAQQAQRDLAALNTALDANIIQSRSLRGDNALEASLLEQNRLRQLELQEFVVELQIDLATRMALGDVFIDAELQYFEMVASALGTIHSILGERLRNSGAAETTGLFNQVKELVKEHKAAEDALKPPNTQNLYSENGVRLSRIEIEQNKVKLRLDELRPRIETCVLQARSS